MLCSKDYETETASACEQFSSVQFSSGRAVHLHLYGLLTMLTLMLKRLYTHTHTHLHTHLHTLVQALENPPAPFPVWESASHIVYLIGCLSACMSDCLSLCLSLCLIVCPSVCLSLLLSSRLSVCVYLLYHLLLPTDNLYYTKIFNLIKAWPQLHRRWRQSQPYRVIFYNLFNLLPSPLTLFLFRCLKNKTLCRLVEQKSV